MVKAASSNWDQFIEYVHKYPSWVVELISGFMIGFLLGFALKMFGKPIIYTVIMLSVANYFLSYFGVIEFHSTTLLQMIGINEAPSLELIFSAITLWVSQHIVACISGVIGFLFGWRLG